MRETGRCFFYRFAKSERDNSDPEDLLTLREVGAAWLAADSRRIARALDEDIVQEVKNGGQET